MASVSLLPPVDSPYPVYSNPEYHGQPYATLNVTGENAGKSELQIDEDGRKTFHTFIGNSGNQSSVDACTGGLTYFVEVSEYVKKPYFPIHNYCGGAPIMDLEIGDLVNIDYLGRFEIISMLDVTPGDTAHQLADLPGAVYVQTCHDTGPLMRVLGVVREHRS